MQVSVEYGRSQATLEVDDAALVESHADQPLIALDDPAAAVRAALEAPLSFPPLRRALTPDDQIVIVVDERLPQLVTLLVPVLEQVVGAGVDPASITLLCAPPSTSQPWLDELPDQFEEVRCEVHEPRDRKRLALLSRMKSGKLLVFNRTAVDASQIIVLAARRYDALLGHGGGEGMLYPTLSEEDTRGAATRFLSLDAPGRVHQHMQAEAAEAVWLLGVPFFVQVIEGAGDSIAAVLAGVAESLAEGRKLLDKFWRRRVSRDADLVIATLGGLPERQTFADLADALTSAARVLRPGGRIVLLTEAAPKESIEIAFLRDARDPARAVAELEQRSEYGLRAAWQWASIAKKAKINMVSALPHATVEKLFAVPLGGIDQVQQLVGTSKSCLILEDAHKTLACLP